MLCAGIEGGKRKNMTDEQAQSAFGFHGNWKDFGRIALPNLLLTIVTLGVYRFWAITRERRYLWSQTRFIDEHLEWTGTGKELFFGFGLVLILFGIPYFVMQVVAQRLMLNGQEAAGAILTFAMLAIIFYLLGVARFRALRYRLGRTRWRGIRGGSDNPGFLYGLSYMWKTAAGILAMGLMVPWSMVSLWNQRWRAMSFGPLQFEAHADFSSLMKRYLLFYLSPFLILIVLFVIGAALFFGFNLSGEYDAGKGVEGWSAVISVLLLFYVLFFVVYGFIYLVYYAKYFRVVIGEMELGKLQFGFDASTKDWIKLGLGDIAVVVLTLGIGYVFLSYRHWKFFVIHMHAYGEVNVDDLTQSTTRQARHGEGLLDAFDVGAI